MLKEWMETAIRMSHEKADFYTGARKILRNRSFTFKRLGRTLQLYHAGYTESKRTHLNRLYYNEQAIEAAQMLWERRLKQAKYGSVSFHCYNHLVKSDPNKGSKRGSVMGPCIQAVSLTYLETGHTAIDAFYRTTELYKKFPADLVWLRDNVVPQFNFKTAPIQEINFHFANVTCHPMYFITLLPWSADPVKVLEDLRAVDNYFWSWVVKWTARYLCDEQKRGIEKFAQAMRVHDEFRKHLADEKKLDLLATYLRDNHPGYRRSYKPQEGEPDDEELDGEGD